MDGRTTKRIHHVTAAITLAALAFYLFFQLNKGGLFRDINPYWGLHSSAVIWACGLLSNKTT